VLFHFRVPTGESIIFLFSHYTVRSFVDFMGQIEYHVNGTNMKICAETTVWRLDDVMSLSALCAIEVT
jgi:hypothetical protein